MSRVAYFREQVGESESELVARIRARRGGTLLNLDRMLLNSPAFAGGWNAHLRAVRTELSLPPKLRELAICAVAVLNGAVYELEHHAPELLRAGGTTDQLQALQALESSHQDPSLFDAAESALLGLTVEMTRNVRVSDVTFESARAALGGEQQVVELVGVIATYNMVSRFLVALEVDLESG
jgi:AhpD family alkylhydroperoxidase